MTENVAQLPQNAVLGIGALHQVGGFLELLPCICDSGGNAGLLKSGEVVQVVAKVDGLLFFDP